MSDVNKPKLQLRSGLSTNGDKPPSPSSKLLINHGKPNFTIQRSMKAQNGNVNPTSPTPVATYNVQNNNNEFVVKSTTFNGVFKPSNISAATKETLPQNGNTITRNDTDNEAAKVVLRRAKVAQTEMREGDGDENVPEFIRRQRRIQERLANQNILDFENRRSGYFTQVLISPTSPNRQSFVETMASPAVKPGLEMPPPSTQHEDIEEETIPIAQEHEQPSEFEKNRENVLAEHLNGHVEEEEVAKAIEEVNKAVEGEDDEKLELEEQSKSFQQESEQNINSTVVTVTALLHVEETKTDKAEKQIEEITAENQEGEIAASTEDKTPVVEALLISPTKVPVELVAKENDHVDATVVSAPLIEDKIQDTKSNGLVEAEHLENGHLKAEKLDNQITISHVNGLNGPSIPPPDPKGEKGVNFETKTVVSFSQELGNGDNNYPDTVKVVRDVETSEVDSELKGLTKLKFAINADNQDIEIKPVLITENI